MGPIHSATFTEYQTRGRARRAGGVRDRVQDRVNSHSQRRRQDAVFGVRGGRTVGAVLEAEVVVEAEMAMRSGKSALHHSPYPKGQRRRMAAWTDGIFIDVIGHRIGRQNICHYLIFISHLS